MTMTTLPLRITAGVDTHLDVHVAAALDETGSLLGVESFTTTTAGYRRMLAWLRGFGQLELVGIEGTGSYGEGLTRVLLGQSVRVLRSTDPTASAVAGGARAILKTPSPQRAPRSRATRGRGQDPGRKR